MEPQSGYYGFRKSGLITGLSYKVRKDVYDLFYSLFGGSEKIADVGVAAESQSREANVLEALFPQKERITAIGIEDAEFLEAKYQGMKFVKVRPNDKLPFEDNHFDVVYSHAVIEHIVDWKEKTCFVNELLRVGKSAFITTPNKYFPIEPHTFTPLIHFLFPKFFYWLIDRKIINKFYNSQNLKLMSYSDLKDLASEFPDYNAQIRPIQLFGFVSNWVLILRK